MASDDCLTGDATLLSGTVPEPEISELEADEEIDDPSESEEVVGENVTEHTDDAVRLYLREIWQIKLLSAEEERELAARLALGDKEARDRMITSNLRLVVKIAKRYQHRGLSLLDLIEEGNLGIFRAVERFDLSKECRFSTYATWWIRQSVERALMNQARTIRLPVYVTEDILKMGRVTRKLQVRENRVPSAIEVADAMDVEVSRVCKLVGLLRGTYSLDQPMGENGDYLLSDAIEDTLSINQGVQVEVSNLYDQVIRHLETFTDTEKSILTLRFGLDDQEPQTLEHIGRKFGVTRERIRQIEVKSLSKLRQLIESSESAIAYC